MKIVQVAPAVMPLPGSGGIERVVYNLSDELVRRGHEVYVYAPSGSKSKGIIIPYGQRGFNKKNIKDFVLQTLPEDIDVIHDHTNQLVIGREHLDIPTISTIHTQSRLNISVKCPVYVSKTKLLQSTNKYKGAYVHNGIDLESYTFSEIKEDYLLYLGRIDKGKGVEDAIKLGEQTGIRTIIAGPVFSTKLFKEIHPQIEKLSNITYVGEVHGEKKQTLLRRAKWLVFPNEEQEQFGLVLVEAMACGTPVAAYGRGGVLDVLEGLPMFICSDLDHMGKLVSGDSPIKPQDLRKYVARRFTKERMTDRYLELYQRAIDGWK
ncbi:glycosyltransferase [Domibacillus sp. PGB-M46]|uniref:glycosyltransferase n=1 Tax=Domibacillus sp. PGB-M46 TaxID=2910255 RepID=UPI001F57E436|nr:glycosyltransferase [Domibacillus sp. PGB-M46]MCI2257057.1 glycosyltransferase [Domibacillus sp. PGB-M46]